MTAAETKMSSDDLDVLLVAKSLVIEHNKGKRLTEYLTFMHDQDDQKYMNLYKGTRLIIKHASIRELYYALTAITEYERC